MGVPLETYSSFNADATVVLTRRGDIVDLNNKILAANDELYSISANPMLLKDDPKKLKVVTRELSRILSISERTLNEKLTSKKSFVWVKRQVSQQVHSQIQKANLTGVATNKEFKRIYPNEKLASHILGFCDVDNVGIEGIEKSMNEFLTFDNKNDFNNKAKTYNGYNVQLTIDANIQAMAEYTLEKHARKVNAESGCLILLDGRSGRIEALASYPNYNPNNYSDYTQSDFRNNAIFYQYEPGSVFKIFSMASFIVNGGVDFDTVYRCTGAYYNGKDIVKCNGKHGDIQLSGIFKYSCNVGTLQAAETISKKEFYYSLKAFGFGESTGVELPGEQIGLFRNWERWSNRSMLAIPIGQEMSSNALQVAQAATTFINDGAMMRSHIVDKIYDNNGNIIKKNSPKAIRQVIPKGYSKEIITAMSESTDRGGTVSSLKVDGIKFASKSGTAQMFDFEAKKYSNTDVSSSVLAMFPYEAPRYVVYTVLHQPRGKSNWGGIICSYLLNDFIGSLTGYLEIMPPNYTVDAKSFEKHKLVYGYERVTKLPTTMPNLVGVSGGDACDILSELNVDIKVHGRGYVAKQTPSSGESIDANTTIELYLK